MATKQDVINTRDKALEQGASVEEVNTLTRGTVAPIETQEAVEVTQDVPVGSEFDTDFGALAEGGAAPTEEAVAEPEVNNLGELMGAVEGASMVAQFDQESPLTSYLQSNVTSEGTDSYVKELVTLRGVGDDGDLLAAMNSAYQDVLSSDNPQQLINAEKQRMRQPLEREYFESYLPQVVQEGFTGQLLSQEQYVEQKMQDFGDFGGVEAALTDTIAGASVSEREAINDEIVRSQFAKVEQLGRENGTLDNAGDFVANIITDLDFFLSDIGLTNIDTLVDQIDEYQTLPLPQKYAIAEDLVDRIWETSDGNAQNAAQLLALYNDPDFKDSLLERAAWNAVEVGFSATAALGVKAGASLMKGRNLKKSMADLDNPDAAARVNAAQGADSSGDLNRILGQDAQDVAFEAMPGSAEIHGLRPNVVNGFSDRVVVQKEAQDNALKLLEELSNKPKMTVDETKAALKEVDELDARITTLRQEKTKLSKELHEASKSVKPDAKLPKELSKAKPRYNFGQNSFGVEFANDVDKAAYIIAQKSPSKRDADYLKFVTDSTGMTPSQARAYGAEVRQSIKEGAQKALRDGDDTGTIKPTSPRTFGDGGSARATMSKVQARIDEIAREIRSTASQKGARTKKITASREAKRATADVAKIKAGVVPSRYKVMVDEEARKLQTAAAQSSTYRPVEVAAKAKLDPAAKPGQRATNPDAAADMVARNAKNQVLKGALGRIQKAFANNQEMAPQLVEAAARKNAESSALDRLRKQVQSEGSEIKEITRTRSTRDGVEAQFVTDNGTETRKVKFVQDELGTFQMQNMTGGQAIVSSIGGKVLSPDALIGRVSDSFKSLAIEGSSVAGAQSSRFLRELQKATKDIYKGLSRKETSDLDGLLTLGDEEEKVFSVAELMLGRETVEGMVRPNQKTVDAYYAMRAIYDETHGMMDYSIRRAMELEGYKVSTYLDNGELKEVIGKVYEDARGLQIKDSDNVRVVTDQGTVIQRYDQFKKAQTEEFTIVKLAQRQVIAKNADDVPTDFVEHMMVRKGRTTSVDELPPNVLQYNEGFIPRIAPKGRWYIREMTDTGHRTLVSAETRAAAQRWISENLADNKKLVINQDGDLTQTEQTLELADKLGGLFTSPRKKGDQAFINAKGEEVARPRLSAFEATDRYFAAVAQSASMGELRTALLGKWQNSVKELAGDRSIPPLMMDTDLRNILPDVPERQALIDMQDWMKMHMGMGGRDERVFEAMYRHINNIIEDKPFFSENKLGQAIRQGTRDAALTGGNRKLLSLTFDLHLGWFNPAQLFVQASNATLAMSLHPVLGIKALPQALAMRASVFLEDIEKFPDFAKGLRSFAGSDFDDSVKAFQMSGLKDEILRTADYGGVERGLGKGSLLSYRKVAEAGRVAFTEGEMFNRTMTFSIAHKKWLKNNPGKKLSDSPEEVMKVVADSRRMMMNMQRENSAVWQNNLFAYPLQFMQVFAKFTENLLPKMLGGSGNWTGREKLQVLSGQIALYGVAGVPIASQMSGYISQAFGVDGDQFLRDNPEASQAVNEGALGYLTDALGLGNNFSQRVSLVAGIDETVPVSLVKALMATVNGTRPEDGLELLFGPTVNTITRAADGLSQTTNAVMDLYYAPSLESLGDTALTGLRSVASLASTGNSVMKYWKMEKMGGMFTRNGEMLMSYPEAQLYSEKELMFHFLGFPLDEVQQYYDSKYQYRPSVSEIRTEAIKDVQAATEQYMLTGNEEVHRARMAALRTMYQGYDWSGIVSESYRKLTQGESQMEREAQARFDQRVKMPGAALARPDQAFQTPTEANQ